MNERAVWPRSDWTDRSSRRMRPGSSDHLVGCPDCRAVAAAYESDRISLRRLGDQETIPPRDLWARTSAAIEQERAARGSAAGGSAGRRTGRPAPALGVLSGVAVIAVVIGASVLSGGWLDTPVPLVAPTTTPAPVAAASPAATPGPTPIVVGAGDVRWVGTAADGALAFNVTDVSEVCSKDRQPDCAPVSDGNATPVDLTVTPRSISQSPVRNQAIVVGSNGSGSDSVVVVVLPSPAPSIEPSLTPEPTPSVVASPTDLVSDPPPPTETPTPTPTVEPTGSPTVEPTATPTVGPSPTPEPTVAATLAIVSGVKVVGESAAYSPDGEWFAFTARSSDDTTGPDIYVWHVGDGSAHALTDDHASVFASWLGDHMLGSRALGLGSDASGEVAPASFLMDPATGQVTTLDASIWRPVVDPTGTWAVGWNGTVQVGADGLTAVPASGSLVLQRFTPDGDIQGDGAGTPMIDGQVGDFDIRWDETGSWLAIWIADSGDPDLGRLSLWHLDPDTGELTQPDGAPRDVTALSGFSIGDGRLAWATPPGQGGEGSRVQIVAWAKDAVGAVESGPVVDVVLIH